MNYKNLNYEIETLGVEDLIIDLPFTMNYKNLNYEIETPNHDRYRCDRVMKLSNYEL